MDEENHRAAIHSAEAISVDWNNYNECIIDAVQALFDDSKLADVTLACEGQFVTAHQFLLSASSPFFKDLFDTHLPKKGKDAVIILSGIRMKYLRRVLQFVYTGRVQIPPQDLDEFLEAGETLKVKGLSVTNPDRDSSASPERFVNNRHDHVSSVSTHSRYNDVRPPNPKRARSSALEPHAALPLNHLKSFADLPHSSRQTLPYNPRLRQDHVVLGGNLWEDEQDQDQEQDHENSENEGGEDGYFIGDDGYEGSASNDITISRGQVPGRPRNTPVKAETLLKLGKAALQKREGFQLSARAQSFFDYLGHLPPIDAEGQLNKKQIERRKRRFFARCKLCAKEISACGCDHDLLSHLKTHKIALD